jgi:hypothetical protein
MSQLFISYSSKGNFAAIALSEWLVSAGWANCFWQSIQRALAHYGRLMVGRAAPRRPHSKTPMQVMLLLRMLPRVVSPRFRASVSVEQKYCCPGARELPD